LFRQIVAHRHTWPAAAWPEPAWPSKPGKQVHYEFSLVSAWVIMAWGAGPGCWTATWMIMWC